MASFEKSQLMFMRHWKYFVGIKKKKRNIKMKPRWGWKEQGEIRSNILIEKQNYKPKGVGMTGVEIQTQK